MSKYRKKPVVIEAFKWTGGQDQTEDPLWIIKAFKKPEFSIGSARFVQINPKDKVVLEIFTLEGRMHANQGDFVIKGVKDELYPCKPDIFKATYEKLDDIDTDCAGAYIV